jgi:hypothetical protein
MTTITINGRKFVDTAKEFAATLFQPNGTANGFFKVKKRSILLFDPQWKPMAFVNQELVLGSAVVESDGKVWYGYLPLNHALSYDSHLKRQTELETLATGKDHRGYYFK